jgi:hypothetical protein
MKNWKYIEGAKVGNSLGTDIYQHKLDPNQYMVVDWDKQTVTIIVNGHVRDVIKNLNNLSYALHLYKKVNVMNTKSGNDTPWEYAHRKPKVINDDKTGAEEFFKKLSDDVKEREEKDDADIEKVGNASVSGGTFKSDDGSQKAVIDVNPQSGTARVVWFENDRQNGSSDYRSIDLATAAVKRKGLKKVGNFKTGKSALKPGDKVMSFGKKGTVKEVIGENTDNIYGEPLIKVEFEDGTTKTIGEHYMRKVGNTKTGNKTGNSKWELPDGSTATVEDDGTIKIKKPRDSSIYITKLWDKERAEKQLAQKGAKKVGNARYTTREDVISHLDTDLYDICKKVPAGSPSFAYVSELQKKGWDISTISKYTKEIGKIIDQYKVGNKKLKFTDKKDGLKEFVYDEENDKGYIYYDGKLVDTIPHAGQGWLNLIKQKAFSSGVMNKTGNRVIEKESEMSQELKNLLKKAPEWIKEKIQYAFSHGFTIDEKDFINAIKKEVGNSASDDKFAYVMREFDEGKLKTPDGKVVTDPAQAKAIAYSESKKTENGLARARNAMNKKCGNSQVTLWKGNDSVLISEDGTVQYLESNSFETDRDKYGSMQEAIDDLTKKGYRKK